MEHEMRQMRADEYPLLEDFLHRAIFVPPDYKGEIPRSIIYDDPLCAAAIEDYQRLDFEIVGDGFDDSEWLMVREL